MPKISDEIRFKLAAFMFYFKLDGDSSGLVSNKFYSWCGSNLSASGVRAIRNRLKVCDIIELEDDTAIVTVRDVENLLKFKSYHITHDEAKLIT